MQMIAGLKKTHPETTKTHEKKKMHGSKSETKMQPEEEYLHLVELQMTNSRAASPVCSERAKRIVP